MEDESARAVPGAARRAARSSDAPLLLAVSGGLDSMALLHAMGTVARDRVAAVATFDHGTGAFATVAAGHVARVAGAMGLPVVLGHMPDIGQAPDGWEAAWRSHRHAFLAECALAAGACVATAHTGDDQVETVLMRLLRGSGARGLAALEAPGPALRPFLRLRRATLAAYLRAAGVEWVEDPGNASPAHLRNRVRHDLLPALRRVRPGIDAELLRTGRMAAAWRAEVEEWVDRTLDLRALGAGGVSVASAELAGYDRDSLAMLWGAIAGRAGLALDRRGTERVAMFTTRQRGRGTLPLSGGWCLEARPGAYLLYRSVDRLAAAPAALPAEGAMDWGGFRFRVGRADDAVTAGTSWTAWLPADAGVGVRGWSAGDRLAPAGGQPRRRVSRYLSEAGVRGSDRLAWPVVVASGAGEEEVVWIPGVRRSDAATERSGRPVRPYVCERIAP